MFSSDWNGPLLNRDVCRELTVEEAAEDEAVELVDNAVSARISTIMSASLAMLDLPSSIAFASCAPAGDLKFMIAERNPGSPDCSIGRTSTLISSLDQTAINRSCSSDVFRGSWRMRTDEVPGGDGVVPNGVPIGLVVASRSKGCVDCFMWN